MRLDKYLSDSKLISSRTKSKAAILSGKVHVNGILIKDPNYEIKGTEKIQVEAEKVEMPKGYFKLQNLQNETRAIDKNDIVLDLGSSAGGYLLFASEIAKRVYGVEISPEFKKQLEKIQKENLKVKINIDNVFKCDINFICPEPVDIILNDMTLEPILSFAGLERFIPRLKTGGKILMTLKLQGSELEEVKSMAKKILGKNNIDIIKFIESKDRDECFIYGQKLPTKFG